MAEQTYDSLPAFLIGRPRGRYGMCGPCQKCGAWRDSLHRDHIVPRHRGGSNAPSNIQLLCANCHQEKTSTDISGRGHRRPARRNPERWAERNKKIGDAHRGRKKGPQSPEWIAARVKGMSEASRLASSERLRARMADPAFQQRIREALSAPDVRARMAASVKKAWALRKQRESIGG